jgi:peptidoglycan/xylan/chitin deacetylase (PgdA/CDA1 family)
VSSVTVPASNGGKYVALTFDDGPHQILTPRLLDVLKARSAKVTFYVMGVKTLLPHAAEIMNRALAEGHEIGNHVWDHPVLAKISRDKVGEQLKRTSDAINQATGRLPQTMRPPYGNTNAKLNDWILRTSNMSVIVWSLDTNDWKHPAPEELVKRTLKKVKSGDIILMHDIHAGTIAAMPGLVDGLTKQGFKLVTVSELLEVGGVAGPRPLLQAPAPASVNAAAAATAGVRVGAGVGGGGRGKSRVSAPVPVVPPASASASASASATGAGEAVSAKELAFAALAAPPLGGSQQAKKQQATQASASDPVVPPQLKQLKHESAFGLAVTSSISSSTGPSTSKREGRHLRH